MSRIKTCNNPSCGKRIDVCKDVYVLNWDKIYCSNTCKTVKKSQKKHKDYK